MIHTNDMVFEIKWKKRKMKNENEIQMNKWWNIEFNVSGWKATEKKRDQCDSDNWQLIFATSLPLNLTTDSPLNSHLIWHKNSDDK